MSLSARGKKEGAQTAKTTPLARALQAQWTLLQQHLRLGSIPDTAERDLLRVLESLPRHKNTILSDVEGVVPYILAFAVAPIPSERTQMIALGAMQATVGSLVAVWGRKAAAVVVHDFLTMEHNALHALEVTLSAALGDKNKKKSDNNAGKIKSGNECGKTHEWESDSTFTETRSCIIGSALELILMMLTLSEPTAAAALTHPKLIQTMVLYLPNATPTQACDVANILHILSAVEGAAEVLLAYKAYHSAVWYIKTSARVGVGKVSLPNATMTALGFFLRFVIRLAGSPAAFKVLEEDPAVPHVIEELLRSQWVEIVEMACRWLTTVIEQHTAQGTRLVSDIISKSRVGEQLANMLLWSSSMVTHAAAAALCWRWLALANPTALGFFWVSNPNILLAFLQVLVTKLPLTPPPSHTSAAVSGRHDECCENNAPYRLLTEAVCTLGMWENRKGAQWW